MVELADIIRKLLGLDPDWLEHLRQNWDEEKEEPNCGCSLSEECCDGILVWHCDDWKKQIGTYRSATDLIIERNKAMENYQNQLRDRNAKRIAEWEDLKRRGLLP